MGVFWYPWSCYSGIDMLCGGASGVAVDFVVGVVQYWYWDDGFGMRFTGWGWLGSVCY